MNFIFNSREHYVCNLSRHQRHVSKLTWESTDLDGFLVLSGKTKANVEITNDTECKISAILRANEDNILNNNDILLDQLDVVANRISFSEYTGCGGFETHGVPGVYAIYGWEKTQDGVNVYVNRNNIFQFNIEIEVDVKSTYISIEKGGFLRRSVERQYSGSKTVEFKNGVQHLELGSVMYTVQSGKQLFSYPVPEEVQNNGGKFLVFCMENDKIGFKIPDIEGVSIKVSGEK